jgi:arylsulfatase A-like enzyme
MKAIMLMFDSLNRHMLPPYGCDWVHAPNFQRLAKRTATFDRAYICSVPCMPARREIHTGRPEFLHRNWGPLEPFDDSMPELLKKNGIYSHLVTDHYHYWEDSSLCYHTKYSSWEFIRGQEGDPWIGQVKRPKAPANVNGKGRDQDWINRPHLTPERNSTLCRTVETGMEFIRRNHADDNWFLQLECFDPHEPWQAPKRYRDLYPRPYDGPLFDWPGYRAVAKTEDAKLIEHARYQYAALLSMCDAYLGDVLDLMDEHDMWKDTMLIVNTDHGFMLGEHGCWAKNWQPWYEELAHIPFFVWDPRCPQAAGQRRQSLVQTYDLAPTILDFFGLPATPDMLGKSLRNTIAQDQPVREGALFGIFGGHVNVTDGRYVYMRAPVDATKTVPMYTLMPSRFRDDLSKLQESQLVGPLSFTKGCRVLKVPIQQGRSAADFGTLLFDLETDPQQNRPLQDAGIEGRMTQHLIRLMSECDAPCEQFERLGLSM